MGRDFWVVDLVLLTIIFKKSPHVVKCYSLSGYRSLHYICESDVIMEVRPFLHGFRLFYTYVTTVVFSCTEKHFD